MLLEGGYWLPVGFSLWRRNHAPAVATGASVRMRDFAERIAPGNRPRQPLLVQFLVVVSALGFPLSTTRVSCATQYV